MKNFKLYISVFFLIFLMLSFVLTAHAETAAELTRTATLDIYSAAFGGTIEDGALLVGGNLAGSENEIIAIQFDLSGITDTIQQARLTLSTVNDLSCSITSDPILVTLNGMTDSAWNASTPYGTLLGKKGAAYSSITIDPNSVNSWEDLTPGDGLAGYLDGLKGGAASLMLTSTVNGQVFFEDNAGSAVTSGCDPAGPGNIAPTLQLVTNGSPLAVELNTVQTTAIEDTNLVWLVAAIGLGLAGTMLILRRKGSASA